MLVKEGILTKPKNPLKVLGNGKLEVKLTVQAAAFTASAKKKIEEVGGTLIEVPYTNGISTTQLIDKVRCT